MIILFELRPRDGTARFPTSRMHVKYEAWLMNDAVGIKSRTSSFEEREPSLVRTPSVRAKRLECSQDVSPGLCLSAVSPPSVGRARVCRGATCSCVDELSSGELVTRKQAVGAGQRRAERPGRWLRCLRVIVDAGD